MFLFSVGDESGEFIEMDGAKEVCGLIYSREVKEDFSHIQYGVQEDSGSWERDSEAPFLVVRYGFFRTFSSAE